jgi:dihydroxyacetone kinase
MTESFGERRQLLTVIAGIGPPSTACSVALRKGVDGGPSPTMTGLSGSAHVEALICPQILSSASIAFSSDAASAALFFAPRSTESPC